MMRARFDPDERDGGGGGGGPLPQPPDPSPGPSPGPSPQPDPVNPRPTFTGNEEIELLSAADIGRPIPLVYGLHLVGGKVFFQHEIQTGADKGKTLLFAALGVGEWSKRRALFVNGKLVDHTDTSKFHFHPGKAGEAGGETDPGTPNQKTCSFWPSNFTQQPNFPGIAYLSMKLEPDIEAPSPGFQVVGIYETLLVRIFDNVGNQTSYTYSSNPAWIALDQHIRSWIAPDKLNGETLSTAEKDEIDFQAFRDWADDCDFVTPQSSKRWEAHYALTEETDLMRALELSHLLGRAYTLERNGKIAPFMDKARSPVAIVTAADVAEDSFNLGRRSLRDAANRIEVKYRDLDSGKAAGTISTTGVNVTGSGTDFTKIYRPGEPCDLRDGAQAGEVRTVKSVASAAAMVLETAFSVDQSGAAHGNPAQDFAVKTQIEEDTTLQDQVGRPITATFDLGNSTPERAERIAIFLLDRTTKLMRQTGYRLWLGQAGALDHLPGDVLTSPDDVGFDPANTRDFEALEVTVQPDGSVEVAGQEYQDIFFDAASAPPAGEISLPPRPRALLAGGFQIGAVFVPDQLNGASNAGEIDFKPLPKRDHTFWRLPDGSTFIYPAGSQFVSQATLESYTGDVFLIFSQQLCNSERGLAAFQDSHLLAIRHNAGQWQYDNNSAWVNFAPVASDIAIYRAKRNGANWAGVPMEYLGVSLLSQRVLSTLVEYSDGTPIDDLQPGEADANVTETRTSNNTSNVGGSTAADTDTGASRGRNALDSLYRLTTGTALQTVAQLGDAHDRAVGAIDATNIVVAAGINFSRAYANKNLDYIADTANWRRPKASHLTALGEINFSLAYLNKNLGYIADTASWKKTSPNEKTGAGRGWNALDALYKLTTGTPNKTSAEIETGVGRATSAIDATNIVVTGGIDFARLYTNKNQDNLPAGATYGPIRLDTLTSGRPDLSKSIQNKTLQYIADTASWKKTSPNEKTGAGRGWNALDALYKLTTGTPNKTSAEIETGVGRATSAIDATNIVVTGGIDFARAYANKHLGNIADTASRFAAAEAGANKTETRTAAAISGQGALATVSAAAWASQVSGRPTELTDGRVGVGLTSAGVPPGAKLVKGYAGAVVLTSEVTGTIIDQTPAGWYSIGVLDFAVPSDISTLTVTVNVWNTFKGDPTDTRNQRYTGGDNVGIALAATSPGSPTHTRTNAGTITLSPSAGIKGTVAKLRLWVRIQLPGGTGTDTTDGRLSISRAEVNSSVAIA